MLLIVMLILTTSCAPSFNSQEGVIEENQDESGQETAIIPSYNIAEDNYKVMIPYKIGKARGVITNQVANRVDIDELEEGLRRHSKQVYDPDTYFFQEGQYITDSIVYEWLERFSETEASRSNPEGLNPAIEDESDEDQQRANPKYLSHILEQNYIVKTEGDFVELGGISIGIALKSVYTFQTEDFGASYYEDIPMEDLISEGKQIAQQVLSRVRQIEGLEEVPVLLSLFREEAQNSLVPGNFIAKTFVEEGNSTIGAWENINEEHILFPSSEANEKYPEMSDNLGYFEQDIAEYFPNYVSVIGKGFYIEDELQKLTIEIPVSFNGNGEIIGFNQYIYGLVTEGFQNNYDLEINVTSNGRQESLITRNAGEDDLAVHIYH